jgi:hypothetical protein
VVVNVSGTAKKIALDGIGVDLISGREKPRNLELAPYDVVVIKRSGSR